MYKEIPAFEEGGILFKAENALNKVAHYEEHIPPKLAHVMKEIQANPDPNYAYLYDRAMGCGEVYGANKNGDWFGREELIRHHDSFVKHAHLYRHHQNKDPSKASGDVMAAAYNDPLDVVDLILRAPIEKVASDIAAFESGKKMIQTSMGAKVPYDICSICGNKAKTRSQYCGHLKFQMLQTLRDGRRVFARNPRPRFVDISIVLVHADNASIVLKKIASLKSATIKKNDVGGNTRRGVINQHVIEAASTLGTADAIHTLHESYGPLRPDEFKAVLEKDASYIQRDIVPYVTFEKVPKIDMLGTVQEKLAHAFADIEMEPINSGAMEKRAGLSKMEKIAYLQYRIAKGLSRDFIK